MPSGITIIGLGPGCSQYWTRTAYQHLFEAAEVYLSTIHHPSIADIPGQIHTFDYLNQPQNNVIKAYQQLAAEIVRLGQRQQGITFAVPGHPNLDEASVPYIQAQAQAAALSVTILPGLSFLDATCAVLNLENPLNLQIVDFLTLVSQHHPALETGRPVLIPYLAEQATLLYAKQTLLNAYPDDLLVTLLQALGTAQERIWTCSLAELDRQTDLDQTLTTLYLPASKPLGAFSALQETIAHLRSPMGCPWDLKQTHQSLRPYLLEEAYEVLAALDANDADALAEELGDLLLQVVLHTQIAIDNGEFKMETVIDHLNRKLIRRHPHIFGDVSVADAAQVVTNWEVIKKAEKAAKGQSETVASVLDGVPPDLPALAQALTISNRAVRVGFEWPNIEGVLDKIVEEAQEIVEATNPSHLESEIGDLLFSAVNLARWQKIDPESALRATNARFTRRFKNMELLAAEQGQSLSTMSIEALEVLWQQAKKIDDNQPGF